MTTFAALEQEYLTDFVACNNKPGFPAEFFKLLLAYYYSHYQRYELVSDSYSSFNKYGDEDKRKPEHIFEHKFCPHLSNSFPLVRGLDPRDDRDYALRVALYGYGTGNPDDYEPDHLDEIFNRLVDDWHKKEAILDIIDGEYNGSLEKYMDQLEKTRLAYIAQLDHVGVNPIYFFAGCLEERDEKPLTSEVRQQVLAYQNQAGGLVELFDQQFEAICQALFKYDKIYVMRQFVANSNMYFLCRIACYMYQNNITLRGYDWSFVIDWTLSQLHWAGCKHNHRGIRFSEDMKKQLTQEVHDYLVDHLPPEAVKKFKADTDDDGFGWK